MPTDAGWPLSSARTPHAWACDTTRRTRSPRLRTCLQLFWVATIAWCEWGTYVASVRRCAWPAVAPRSAPGGQVRARRKLRAAGRRTQGPALQSGEGAGARHVLVVADPQVITAGSYPGRPLSLHRISEAMVDFQLRKSWSAALSLKPDAVVFLGDMMDRGRANMADSEYEAYYARFKHIFRSPPSLPVYYLPGNHDTGLGSSSAFATNASQRFAAHFGPLNRVVQLADHSLVLVDAPGLVDEDTMRLMFSQSLQHFPAPAGGAVDFIKTRVAPSTDERPVVVFSHIPLARPPGSHCGPLRERGTIRQGFGTGYQNLLGQDVSQFILQHIQPSVVFSGDDHDYCEYNHALGDKSVREVTVKSFSMACGIRRPGFQLLSLLPLASRPSTSLAHVQPTLADAPCLLPDQIATYTSVYAPLAVLTLFVLLTAYLRRHAPRARAHAHSLSDAPGPFDFADPEKGAAAGRYSRWEWTFASAGPGTPAHKARYADVHRRYYLGGARARRSLVRDVRDVAWPPVVTFGLIWLWMFR